MSAEKINYTNNLLEGAVPGKTESIDEYISRGGYESFKKILNMKPAEVTEIAKASGLRGRGGAGFPAGMKWSFLPKNYNGPIYLTCNADESEPGTCKDRPIIEMRPQLLIEGCLICCYAIGAKVGYIYIRGEYYNGAKVLNKALKEAYQKGLLGENILGTGFSCNIYVHSGGGAYVCGEETGLIESIEGKRGQPRNKPPFPAIQGAYQCPTVINNVETLSCLPLIVKNGPDWFKSFGTQQSTGFRIYSVSGHVKKPGNYELPMTVTLRQLIYDYAGGIKDDRKIKAVIPGGSSTPVLTPDQLDIQMNFEGVQSAGSMLGSAAVIVMDQRTCIVWAALKLATFYAHESCGQCTPCREGCPWILKIVRRIEEGKGTMEDIDKLESICKKIMGRSICALGDAAAMPILGFLKKFRNEFEEHVKQKKCPYKKDSIHIF